MISRLQPFRSWTPTDGSRDNHKQMDDLNFTERLAMALEMNGLTNAAFAAAIGENGQQNINGWKERGQVGSKSLRRVAQLLPLTNVMWLQYGDGEPEAFSRVAESSPNYQLPQSRAARPAVAILAKAVDIITIDEGVNGPYPSEKHAELLLELCDRLVAGENSMELVAKLTKQRSQGSGDGTKEAGGSIR